MNAFSLKRILFLSLLAIAALQSCKKKESIAIEPAHKLSNKVEPFVLKPNRFPDNTKPIYSLININGQLIDRESIKYHNPYQNLGKLKLKGSMHVHTDNSLAFDGYKSGEPKWVAEKLRDEGKFDFYAITDHNIITEDPKIEGIVWMGFAVEDTSLDMHVTAYNLPTNVFNPTKGALSDKMNYYKSIGAYTNLCHPNWSRTFVTESILNTATIGTFVEVMNSTQSGEDHRVVDLLRNKKQIVSGFGVDDFHYGEKWKNPNIYFNKVWIVAFADFKENNAIWKALLKGSFFVTNGPSIDVNFKDDQLKVYADVASEITFMGGTKDGQTIKLEVVKNVLMASYTFSAELNWLRAEVKNAKGLAYTQAIQLK